MNPDSPIVTWLKTLNENSVWVGTKAIYILAVLVYISFAAVVVSQVYQMGSTIKSGFEKPLQLLSWIHLGLSILVLFWAFTAL